MKNRSHGQEPLAINVSHPSLSFKNLLIDVICDDGKTFINYNIDRNTNTTRNITDQCLNAPTTVQVST